MFTTLIQWLAWLWDTVKAIWQGMWNFVKAYWKWGVGVVYAVVAIQDTILKFVHEQLTVLFDAMSTLTAGEGNLSSHNLVGDIFEIGNTFFPLNETVALAEAWSLIVLAGLLYRLIKSWIPTLS